MVSEYDQPLRLEGDVLYLGQTPAVLAVAVKSVTTTYAMQPLDRVILADATSAPFTVTLPSAQGRHGQQALTVKRMNGGGNAVTIGAASGTIDGAATQSLGSQYAKLSMVSDGTQWLTI